MQIMQRLKPRFNQTSSRHGLKPCPDTNHARLADCLIRSSRPQHGWPGHRRESIEKTGYSKG
jgi:hypothetical protein